MTALTCNVTFWSCGYIWVARRKAHGVHPGREFHRRSEFNQGDVIVQSTRTIVLRVRNYSLGANWLLCSFVSIPIVISHNYFVVSRVTKDKQHKYAQVDLELLHYGYAQPSIDKEAYYIVGLSNIVWNICPMKEYYAIVGCELCLAVFWLIGQFIRLIFGHLFVW